MVGHWSERVLHARLASIVAMASAFVFAHESAVADISRCCPLALASHVGTEVIEHVLTSRCVGHSDNIAAGRLMTSFESVVSCQIRNACCAGNHANG